jgi:glycosyltransferase involved in cell wall biosynthesis
LPTAGIKLLIIGHPIELPYDIKVIRDSSAIMLTIAQFQPDVILTNSFVPGALNRASFEIRKRWVHTAPDIKVQDAINTVENCYAHNLWTEHPQQHENPLISVYTGAYNTGDYLREAYQSLKDQTYQNWEWVVMDDHSTDGTWERLEALAREDIRVRPYRSGKKLEKIGAVKDQATRLSGGVYLVELDHDDMLTDFALAEIKDAFEKNPDVGFVYSNCSNFLEGGGFHKFTDDFWKERYRETEYRGKKWTEYLNPDIYDRLGPEFHEQFGYFLTLSPNHVRAFRAKKLFELGGYNPNLPVVDDWDLSARMFLHSKCLHIDRMLYLYRFKDNRNNTWLTKNKSIQDHLGLGQTHYTMEFRTLNDERFKIPPLAVRPQTLEDISFVVIEAAVTPLTIRCLESIRKHAPGAEIVYVDNGTSTEIIHGADRVIRFASNLGFAAGCNAGAEMATRPILCFLNNEACFIDETPAKLLAALSNTHPVVGPYSNQAKPPQGDVQREATPSADAFPEMVMGFCMMMPKLLYQWVGGFDPEVPTYEADQFCLKLTNLGLKVKVVGGTWVQHDRYENAPEAVTVRNEEIFRKKHPVIRVIVIAKDEEKTLPGFFKPWEQVTRDWCVLDTGSTDNTIEVAKSLGCRVENGPFEDFASARNQAVARFGAGADWIVMLDPDERMDEHTILHLKELVYRTNADILYSPLQAKYPDGNLKRFVSKPFAWRNKPEIMWVFKVHEKLIGSQLQAIVMNAMNTHLLELHEDWRRQAAAGFYQGLMKEEPYFTDPAYKGKMVEAWPILDYDRMEDPRIRPIYAGPLVSVVMPTYKRVELLDRAIASALAQDYANLEVVVMGDGCPDLAEIMSLGSPFPRVRIYNLSSNHGAGGAVPRNHAIAASGGPWIAYLDDDNAWKPDHISSLYQAVRANGASYAFSSMEVKGIDLQFKEPKRGSIDTSCILHRKSLIERYGGWKDRTAANYYHDWEFVSRWVQADEKWAATGKATLIYNYETCGQREFIDALASSKAIE